MPLALRLSKGERDATERHGDIRRGRPHEESPKDLLEALKRMGYEFDVINSSEVCRVRVWQLAR